MRCGACFFRALFRILNSLQYLINPAGGVEAFVGAEGQARSEFQVCLTAYFLLEKGGVFIQGREDCLHIHATQRHDVDFCGFQVRSGKDFRYRDLFRLIQQDF